MRVIGSARRRTHDDGPHLEKCLPKERVRRVADDARTIVFIKILSNRSHIEWFISVSGARDVFWHNRDLVFKCLVLKPATYAYDPCIIGTVAAAVYKKRNIER